MMTRRLIGAAGVLALLTAATPARAIDPTLASAAGQVLANQTSVGVEDGAPRQGGLLGSIFGCSTGGNSQTIGAVAGGALGGMLGNRIAGSGSRTLGTLLGGALGAAAGSALGCRLQRNDRMRAERAAQTAIATGNAQTWRNDETGASGTVAVGPVATGLGDLRFANGVEPASGFAKVGDSFVATSAANIRSAPGTIGQVLGRLAPGQRVFVPAQVRGQPWMLVAEGGVGQGYVSAPLLRRATTATAAASNCRLVTQTVSLPNEPEASEKYHACKGADGQWTMTRV
jgi:surface antigen